MIRIAYFNSDFQVCTSFDAQQIELLLMDNTFFWVDIAEEPADVCEKLLCDVFHFHPLAVDDALKEIHVPKIDDWGDYLYLVIHSVVINSIDEAYISTLELDIFVSNHYIVTYQEQHIPDIEALWQACFQDERYLKRGSAFLLYRLIDQLADSTMLTYDTIEDAIERVEDQIFDSPTQKTLEQIFALKRILLYLRRIVTPQRNVLGLLARSEYAALDVQYKMFFRDVYDHYVRLTDINESMRELISEALNSYLSVVNNRLNDVMKVLTIITTFFMPISFISGFFGMNFFQPVLTLDAWTGKISFIITLSVIVILPLSMYLYIKKHHWM